MCSFITRFCVRATCKLPRGTWDTADRSSCHGECRRVETQGVRSASVDADSVWTFQATSNGFGGGFRLLLFFFFFLFFIFLFVFFLLLFFFFFSFFSSSSFQRSPYLHQTKRWQILGPQGSIRGQVEGVGSMLLSWTASVWEQSDNHK